MPDPNTPSITESVPTGQKVSLGDLTQRYLTALQRNFDVTAYLVEGTRRVDERTYDEFSAAVRFQPSQKDRQRFDVAKEDAERWLLKSLLAESLSLVVPFLEDVRSIAGLAAIQAGGKNDQVALQKLLGEDRQAFLALDLADKFKHLQTEFAISSPISGSVLALTKLGVCIAARRGVVSDKDVTDGSALVLSLVALDLVPTTKPGEAAPTIVPQVGELKRTFSIGETIRMEKTDYLNVITTLAIFINSTMKSVQTWVQAKQGA